MSWEKSMATRAEERRAHAERMAPRDPWDISHARAVRGEWQLQARMTLGEAMDLFHAPSWACACIGFPDCCLYRFDQARALQRGAHIVAKLIAAASSPAGRTAMAEETT